MSKCKWCGNDHGPKCPEVKSIEYFEDGSVKKVEFYTFTDKCYPFPSVPAQPQFPSNPTIPWTWPYITTCEGTHG